MSKRHPTIVSNGPITDRRHLNRIAFLLSAHPSNKGTEAAKFCYLHPYMVLARPKLQRDLLELLDKLNHGDAAEVETERRVHVLCTCGWGHLSMLESEVPDQCPLCDFPLREYADGFRG